MPLIGNTETPSVRNAFYARIVAEFRERRFTGRGFARWSAIAAVSVLAAALVTLYFLDWNSMRGPIGRYVSAWAGREVRIDGPLKVDLFRLQPHVEIGGLFIGNPDWVRKPQGAAIAHSVVEFRLFPALFGHLKLPLVEIDGAEALIVRDEQGRSNWDTDPKGPAAAWKIPPINRFLVKDGHLEIDDEIRKLKFLGTISSQERAGAGASAFQLKGDGTLNGNKFLADVHGGPLINVDESRPYAFDADITAGDTRAVLKGSVIHPFHLDQFESAIAFSGKSLSDLFFLTGLALPHTPPYRITAELTRNGAQYRMQNLSGVLGSTDLKGDLAVDASGDKPVLRGNLASKVLDFSDLGTVIGGGKTNPGALPDTVLHTERLRLMDADVSYTAQTIRSQDFPLRGLSSHIVLLDSVLTLKPLSISLTQGKLSGSLKIDARSDVPVTSIDAMVSDIHMENFIKNGDKPVSGMVEARAVLTGRGNSAHKAASTANGTLTAAIPSGRVRHSLAEWMGINVLSALSLTLSDNQEDTGLRCAVAHFNAQNGILTSQQFVIDTDPVLIEGGGAIDMNRETMDLRLQGKPKHFQLFCLRAPVSVSGAWDHPALGVDAKPLVTQGAVGAGLGLASPFAAILAFLDPGLAKNADCAGLIGTAQAQGAPVKGKS